MRKNEVERVSELDVSEDGVFVFKQTGNRIEKHDTEWHRPRWDAAKCRSIADGIISDLESGGVMLGAFDGELLIGLAVLRYRLEESVAELSGLWVSRDYRRKGVARQLASEIFRLAKDDGEREIYVSAMPSESAMGFYMSQGFRATAKVNEELFRQEPEDIHMRKAL
jgi:ribosomal protein S18 acetylase RimI-like enzyme